MSESGKIRGQPNPQKVESLATGSLNPERRNSRASSMRGQVSGVNGDFYIDIHQQQRPLITKQKDTKWLESNRRYDRIVDIVKMLEDNNALTPDERAWLVKLGSEHYEQYCQLGDLLQVSMLGSPGRHGVWRLEDRNKIRMQIMKAAVREAMEVAPADDTDTDNRMRTDGAGIDEMFVIECALGKAEQVRRAMLRDTGCRNIEAHKYVTRKTLQDPRIFYAISNRKHANAMLRQLVKRPSDINSRVSGRDQRRAAKALELLVNNDLLDTNAATNLLHHLRKKPQHITALMSDTTPRLESKADRQKVRALALLALAYNDANAAVMMRNDLLTMVNIDWQEAQLDDDESEYFGVKSIDLPCTGQIEQEKFYWFLDLPPSGRRASKQARNDWIAWAKSGWAFANDSKSDIQGDKGGPNVKAGDNNNDPVNDESKKDIDDLPNLIEEEDPAAKKGPGKNSNAPAAKLAQKNPNKAEADVPAPRKNNDYKRIDQTLSDDDLKLGDVGSSLEYEQVEYGGLKQDKFAHSRPVVLELRRNDNDRKLMEAMAALEGQEWSKTPFGASPLFPPGENFATASSKLSNYLGVFKLAADTMLGPVKDDKMPLTVTPHIGGVIADARANALTARSELALLRKKLNASDVSQQKPDGGKRAAFEKDIAKLMDQLNAIIRDTGLILYRANKAAPEQSGSLKSNENNNNNNNNAV